MEGARWWGNWHCGKVLRFLLWVASQTPPWDWCWSAGKMQVEEDRGFFSCQEALPGSVLLPSMHQDSCKARVAHQKGAVSSGTSRARSELMAPPQPQPVQPQPSQRAPGSQGAEGTEWAGSRGRRRTGTAVNPRKAAALQCRRYPQGKHWDTHWEASQAFGRARRGLRNLISIIHIFLSSHLVLLFFLPALLEGSVYHSQQVFIFHL